MIKKGEHGVYVFGGDFRFAYPAYPVERVVDPTGAGDTFAGGFFGFLSKSKKMDEKTLRRGAVYGTVMASFNVEGLGMGRTAPLTSTEVERRLTEYHQFCAFA